ncbi:MAG TPA: DEAD/DEAH box helicase [Methanospirillum sp.]|uniref:DEAD/DEAH box helicase n=1 Tax=Methanospirillum sp. TaxID=45200 RepID=UPI002D10EC8E|nr:DEAD/DEAH box helicase [Methanospirillum sp.]HWQ63439.1 DEAD/DEAH box helicase [Methanospirillum sp.]
MSTQTVLDPRVVACISERGFDEFSEVQQRAIPKVLAGEHLLLIAPTGTGKTESAMIPVFNQMLSAGAGGGKGFTTLYITPLRSLNRDILRRMEWWCSRLGFTVGVRHGDTTQSERRKQTLSPPDLLVTTPETLQAIYMGRRLREHLKQVQFVILDEIHDLAGTKRGAQMSMALERLVPYAGEFQRIGLSATVGNPEEVARFMTGRRPYTIVEVPVTKHIAITVELTGEKFEDQVKLIRKHIKEGPPTLIFVNTRATAESLGMNLLKDGGIDVHHGSLSRDVRIEAEERFKNGEIRALICTSSMELGIDIGHVDHVIQFGSPREVSRLVQRVGRAGHQIGKISRGTIIASGFDELAESLVITRRALAGQVEEVVPTYQAGDAIANQIAAMAVEYGEISTDDIISILSGSSISLDAESVVPGIISQLAEHYILRRDGGRVITTGRARKYLSNNLSMIPDERKFPIYDMVSRRTVGSLDESFVVTYLHTGAVFIARGHLWRVLEMEEGKITVEPAKSAEGELPSWEGEQIPVPFAVAREVGALRRTRQFSDYSSDQVVTRYAEAYLVAVENNRGIIPTDEIITIEQIPEGIVINLCAGHQTNEAFGRVISILISARWGTTVGIELDAYRILLRLPREVVAGDVQEIIQGLDPEHLRAILEVALKRTSLFKWKLVQIAKKFGAIDADADYERLSMHRLGELLSMPAIQAETYRELFTRYMDVTHAAEIVNGIKEGSINIVLGPPSMIGASGIFSHRDQIPPPTADQAVISTIKHRLAKQEVILTCMNCRKWKVRTVVDRVPEHPVCGHCNAKLIAALKPYEEEQYSIANKKTKNTQEKEIERRLIKNANIVLSSGKKAVLVLAAKGVGPDTASRILATWTDGDSLYREILKAERNFIRTHKFWQS